MGLFLGFIVNVFSSVYYGMYIVGDLQWSEVNHQQLVGCALALLALVGYLQFFIADYPNTFEFSKAYAKRYYNYFLYRFWPGRILRVIIGLYILLFLLATLGFIWYFMTLSLGYLYGSTAFIVIMSVAYLKERLNRKHA